MGLITPRQLGPMMRMPYSSALATRSRSSWAPSSPTSLKPAEMTTAVGTPASPHSSMMPGIDLGGVTMTARSTCSGMDAMLGWALDAQDAGALGVDRVDGAAEGAGDEVAEDGAADAAGLLGGTDEGHGLGLEEGLQRAADRLRWTWTHRPGRGGVAVVSVIVSLMVSVPQRPSDGPVSPARAVHGSCRPAPSVPGDCAIGRRLWPAPTARGSRLADGPERLRCPDRRYEPHERGRRRPQVPARIRRVGPGHLRVAARPGCRRRPPTDGREVRRPRSHHGHVPQPHR